MNMSDNERRVLAANEKLRDRIEELERRERTRISHLLDDDQLEEAIELAYTENNILMKKAWDLGELLKARTFWLDDANQRVRELEKALREIERRADRAIRVYEQHGGFIAENEPLYKLRTLAHNALNTEQETP